MVMKRRFFAVGLALGILSAGAIVACGGEDEEGEPLSQEIRGGIAASAYESAALIDIEINGQVRSICSGSLIAPRVVLTAGHCVAGGGTGFRVTLPYAGMQRGRSSRRGVVYDYVD